MSTILNDRDVLLQQEFTRNINLTYGKLILLAVDKPGFTVSVAMVGSPEEINFTAIPVNIPGTATWNVTAGGTLVGSGNTRTLAFDDMSVDQVTVSVSITYLTITYTAERIINKVYDDVRVAVIRYITGSYWADAAATAAVGGTPVYGDTVTVANGSDFINVRTWNGTEWAPAGVVMHGALVVDNSITAAAINTNNLTIRDAMGVIIFSATVQLEGTYIANATILSAHIDDLAVTSEKIDDVIESSNYDPGVEGWQINKDGTMFLNEVVSRGSIKGGDFTSFAFPASGGTGFYLGEEGLMIGNDNDDAFLQIDANGDIYSPAFTMVAGVLTISQLNVIDTFHLAGNAVTVPTGTVVAGPVNYDSTLLVWVESADVVVDMGPVNDPDSNPYSFSVVVFFAFEHTQVSGGNQDVFYRVKRNGSVIATGQGTHVNNTPPSQNTAFIMDTSVPGGIHTYSLENTEDGDVLTPGYMTNINLLVMGAKR